MDPGNAFFKAILSAEKMQIPPSFCLKMQGALASSVILRDRYKNLWRVEVARIGDDWYFKKGWPQFYNENSLEPGDFLVFEYKGDNLFDVKLLGYNACEKNGVGALKFRIKEEEQEKDNAMEEKEEEADNEKEEEKTLVDSSDDDEEDDDDEDEDDDYVQEEEEEDDDDDEDYVQEEGEDEEEEQVNISKKIKPKTKSKSCHVGNRNSRSGNTTGVGTAPKRKYRKNNATKWKRVGAPMYRIKEEAEEEEEEELMDSDGNEDNGEDEGYMEMENEDNEEEEQVNVSTKIKPESTLISSLGVGTIPSKRRYRKQNIPDCYGADIFKSGLAPRPKNPYFVTRSRTARRKNELHIPKDVIVDYHLNIPERLFLVDENGNKFETKIKQWKDGRLWCSKGWRNLCNVNIIDKDDVCICEFVRGGGEGNSELCMLVRRVVDGLGK